MVAQTACWRQPSTLRMTKRIPLTHCAKLSTILKSESFILSHFIKWKFELLQEGVEQESPI